MPPATASMGGLLGAEAPGGVVVTPPFSDNFNRADGDPGQPWFNPFCGRKRLQIVSDTLQCVNEPTTVQEMLLLDSGDLDVTFTVNYSALRSGVRDDVQFWFRRTACAPPGDTNYGVTTQPNTAAPGGGTHGVTFFQRVGSTFTLLDLRDVGSINEGDTHTFRVHVYGTNVDIYLDNLTTPFMTETGVSLLTGQNLCYFSLNKALTSIDDVSFA